MSNIEEKDVVLMAVRRSGTAAVSVCLHAGHEPWRFQT